MAPQIETVTSAVVPLLRDHVDTDQIIPARFLKTTEKSGLADKLFRDWRFTEAGAPVADFVLNRPEMAGRRILLAGDNFGCGSSREHAPWALVAYGFQAVVAAGFADIFRGNALKNGLIPVALEQEPYRRLCRAVESDPDVPVTVDLRALEVRLPGEVLGSFEVDAFARRCLLEGLDELGYLLAQEPAIAAYEDRRA